MCFSASMVASLIGSDASIFFGRVERIRDVQAVARLYFNPLVEQLSKRLPLRFSAGRWSLDNAEGVIPASPQRL
jgi:hypothetical protein